MKPVIYKFSVILTLVLFLILGGNSFGQMYFDYKSNTLPTGDAANIVTYSTYAFLANTYGLTIMDFTDITNPNVISFIGTDGVCHGIDIKENGNYVYLADGYNGLVIVNATDRENPVIVSTLDLAGNARDLDYASNKVFVAMEEVGIKMIDVTNPAAPVVLSTFNTPGRAFEIKYLNGYAYVADDGAVTSFNTANNTFAQVQTYAGDNFNSLTLNGGRMFATRGTAVNIFTLGTAGAFTYSASATTTAAKDVSPLGASNVVIADDASVSVISPTGSVLGTYSPTVETVQGVFGFTLVGINFVAALEGIYGAELLNAMVPSNMTLMTYIPYEGGPRNIVVSGNYAYIAYHLGGLVIMNVADPTAPYLVAQVPIDGWSYDISKAGNYVYVAEWFTGLYSFNVTTPAAPVPVDTFLTGLEGSRATAVLATTDPTNLIMVHSVGRIYKFGVSSGVITLLGSAETDGIPKDVKADGTNLRAFVADFTGGADIYNVSGDTPVLLGSYIGLDDVRAVDYVGNYMYVGSASEGIDIVDITNVGTPTFVSNFATQGDVNGMVAKVISGNTYAFPCDWANGVEIVNVTTPTAPVQSDWYDTYSYAKANYYHTSTNRLYVADSYSMYIFAVTPLGVDSKTDLIPGECTLIQNYPNPFNPETIIRFNMHEDGFATLAIYDLQGREVVKLVDGWYSAGMHEVYFNALNLASGTYFANFTAGDYSKTVKMLLLK
jgi:hypothetical protein